MQGNRRRGNRGNRRNSPALKASGWPNEVSPQGRKSPSGHHRLLVPGRRFAQAEHRHGHPDRLRPRRTRNAPVARCACREAVRLGERSELRSSPAPSGSPTSEARSFAKQSRKRVRGLQQDRVACRGGKADPLVGGSPPRARPARLRGNHGRHRRRRRRGHERGSTAMHSSYDYNDTYAVSSASFLFAAAAFRAIS